MPGGSTSPRSSLSQIQIEAELRKNKNRGTGKSTGHRPGPPFLSKHNDAWHVTIMGPVAFERMWRYAGALSLLWDCHTHVP
jgi:hypothetical protein